MTDTNDTFPVDGAKEIAQRLQEISVSEWLSDEECQVLLQASHLILNLHQSLGVKSGLLKGWDFMLKEAVKQAEDGHRIIASESIAWMLKSGEYQGSWIEVIRPAILQYWEDYAYDDKSAPL